MYKEKAMPLSSFLTKANQTLFSSNILKLFFSYNGNIGRIPYITAVFLLLIILRISAISFLSYIFIFLLFIYCLTALIQKRARSFGSSGTWYILANLLLLYTAVLTYGIDESFFPIIKYFKYAADFIAIVAHLILVFRPSKQNIDEQKRSFLTRFPIIFTILAFVGVFGMFEIQDRYMPDTNRPAFHLGLAVGEIYRHTYAYPEFCKTQGYEMVNYPNKVREKFKEEIEIAEKDQMALLSKASDKKYNNLDDFYKSNEWGTQEERLKAALDFIEALRERLIVLEVAEEQNIAADKVKLTKEDNERVSLKDACKIIDEDADFFVSSDCPFSYILNYAGKYSNCGTYFNTRGQN